MNALHSYTKYYIIIIFYRKYQFPREKILSNNVRYVSFRLAQIFGTTALCWLYATVGVLHPHLKLDRIMVSSLGGRGRIGHRRYGRTTRGNYPPPRPI